MRIILEFIITVLIWILVCAFVHYVIPDVNDSYKMLAGVVAYFTAMMSIDMCE